MRVGAIMKCHLFIGFTLCTLLSGAATARAGHSRFPYLDGGQSVDGRFVVTAELVPPPTKSKSAADDDWIYHWKDQKTGKTIDGKLLGLRSGRSSVFDPVHAHIFVAPDGETFAVWNPNVLARFSGPSQIKDLHLPATRNWEGFRHRLTIYKKSGEIVKALALQDFLHEKDWDWLFCYQSQVYWQSEYSPLTRDNAPRVGYALYRISPDYTVLETMIGATDEARFKAKERGVIPPAPRPFRVDLVSGEFIDVKVPLNPNREPVRPFKGDPIKNDGRGNMKFYQPSLDPVRVEGQFVSP